MLSLASDPGEARWQAEMSEERGGWTVFSAISTVLASVAVIEIISADRALPRAVIASQRFSEATTSSDPSRGRYAAHALAQRDGESLPSG